MGPGFFYRRRRLDRADAGPGAGAVGGGGLADAGHHRRRADAAAAGQPCHRQSIQYRHPDCLRGRVPGHRGSGRSATTRLVTFEKDETGQITAVRSNMAAFNHLQADILDTILTRIDQVSARELSIPVGTLTGFSLLAGRGPRISVRMESVGSSEANFHNEFVSAGINQTKHQIILTVDVSVSILLPGFTTATKVSNSFIVAETVIVGSVPDTYTYFATEPDTYLEDTKDYILNGA